MNRLALTAAAVTLGLSATAASAADPVTLQLKWVTQGQFAGYYVAKDKGFYEEAGLDVTINPGGPDIAPPQVIAGGGADVIIDCMPAALASLQRALGNLPGHVAILTKLSELYVRDGQWNQAVDRLTQIVSQAGAPEAARLDAHARLAAILDERLGDHERARASVEAVLAVDPRHAAALARLVRLEIRRGRLDAA